MKVNNLFVTLLFIAQIMLVGRAGKHNISTGPTMQLVAIQIDAAWSL